MDQVPARIEKLISDKQFYAAVQLHIQSALMLEREGLQTVIYKMLQAVYLFQFFALFRWNFGLAHVVADS